MTLLPPTQNNTARERARAMIQGVQALITEYSVLERVYHDDLTILQDAVPDRGHMLPGTLQAAMRGENPLRIAISRLVTPIVAGGAQWTGDESWPDGAQAMLTRLQNLVPALALNIALYGVGAVFPHFDDTHAEGTVTLEKTTEDAPGVRVPVLSVLQGPILPILNGGKVDRLINFVPQTGRYGKGFVPMEYAPGSVTTYGFTITPATALDGAGVEAKQQHSPGKLPLAYRFYEHDGSGFPQGPGHYSLNAMRRFIARLAQENIVYNASAGPQRVITGDVGGTGQVTAGPYKTIRLPLGASYQLVGPDTGAMRMHTDARKEAANDVLLSAGSPEGFVGAGDSGEARAIAGQMHEQTSTRIGELVAEILTDCAELLYRLGYLPAPIEFTVRPSFPAKKTAEQANITTMFNAKLIDRLEALLRLQDAGIKVSDLELERAKKEREQLEAQAPEQLAQTLLQNSLPWVGLKALQIAYPQLGITDEDVAAQKEIDMAGGAPSAFGGMSGDGTGTTA